MKVKMEGQIFELPDEIAASDDTIRKFLSPYFPEVASALISRTEDTIKIVKRAGTKGATPLEFLIAHPEGELNPIIIKYLECKQLGAFELASNEIAEAIAAGLEEAIAVGDALDFLLESRPAPGHLKESF